jgi:hypothetical protein
MFVLSQLKRPFSCAMDAPRRMEGCFENSRVLLDIHRGLVGSA